MRTRSSSERDFVANRDKNLINSKKDANNTNYKKTLAGMLSESKIEYLGKFFKAYSTSGKTRIKLMDMNVKYIGSEANQSLLKLNALLEIMRYNIDFIEQYIYSNKLISSNVLKSTKGITDLAKYPNPAYQVNDGRGTEISNFRYEGFVSTIQQELAYSSRINPTYNSNDKILWSLLNQIAAEKSISKEEFSELAGRVKEVLNKNQDLYKLINSNKEILRNLYNKCNEVEQEETVEPLTQPY